MISITELSIEYSTYDDSIPFYLMNRRLLLDDDAFAFEAAVLFTETALENGISSDYLQQMVSFDLRLRQANRKTHHVVLLQSFNVGLSGRPVPDKNVETFGMSFDFVPPLHDGNRRADSR